MEPIRYPLNKELSLAILPECIEHKDSCTYTFQLYYTHPAHENSLNDLGNYAGLLTFNWASQAFYYTQGNRAISGPQLLEIMECIKTHIY